MDEASHVRQLAALNARISDAEALRAGIRQRLSAARRANLQAGMSHSYRRMQQLLRTPARSFELWPLGVMLIGPLLPGSLTFAFAMMRSGSAAAAASYFLAVTGATAALFACLLFVPNNEQLDSRAKNAHLRLLVERIQVERDKSALSNVEHELQTATHSRDAIVKSVQYRQELLLQQNWKAMRGPEWEAYLAAAFHLLGGTIEATGKSGDQGVDLIVVIGERRYAVQAKGYVNSVGNSAVQEALAGMAYYRCNCSAVITNSRFTTGAIALAECNCCLLIGEDQIPAFVLGKLSL